MKICFLFICSIFLSFASVVSAAEVYVGLDHRFGDHMVLQQGKSTILSGIAPAKATVEVSFAGKKHSAVVDESGRWTVPLPSLVASYVPKVLVVTATLGELQASVERKDILIGEVWMCSGQSNMALKLSRSENRGAAAAHPHIRMFRTELGVSEEPQQHVVGKWEQCTPGTALEFSAVGYLFGTELAAELDVPIGLIATAWGGKLVEAYTSQEGLADVPEAAPLLEEWQLKKSDFDPEKTASDNERLLSNWKERVAAAKKQSAKVALPKKPKLAVSPGKDPSSPSSLFNHLIAPWTDYAIAGAIWYQGESNRYRAVQYESLFPAMIRDWRTQWGYDFPFYFVQLAAFQEASNEPADSSIWAQTQNAQRLALEEVKNAGMAVANDVGNANDIHPADKSAVAHRLALLALDRTYGKKVGPSSGPRFAGASIDGGEVTIEFSDTGDGLKTRDGGAPGGFAIAADGGEFLPATARVGEDGSSVVVSHPEVAAPAAVRYAWRANPTEANLVNSAGLPTSVFRTDDRPLSTTGRFTLASTVSMTYAHGLEAMNQKLQELGYDLLFNGKDLEGWKNPYSYGEAKVVDGEIHLQADKKFFLVTEESFEDFVLMVDIHLPAGQANSGVMFRAHVEPGSVFGYQAECDGSDRRWSGGLYDEGRRKWLWPSKKGNTTDEAFLVHEAESQGHFQKPEVSGALRRNDWNTYKITCRGEKIRIELNGVVTTEISDNMDRSGPIGIQHHGEKGQVYRFRKIILKRL